MTSSKTTEAVWLILYKCFLNKDNEIGKIMVICLLFGCHGNRKLP